MKNQAKQSALHQNLNWVMRNQKDQVRYDLLFALCVTGTFIGLLTLIVK